MVATILPGRCVSLLDFQHRHDYQQDTDLEMTSFGLANKIESRQIALIALSQTAMSLSGSW